MSEGKLAAQVAHAVIGLRENKDKPKVEWNKIIVVLKASDNKFKEELQYIDRLGITSYLQIDWGLTELCKETPTAVAFYEA